MIHCLSSSIVFLFSPIFHPFSLSFVSNIILFFCSYKIYDPCVLYVLISIFKTLYFTLFHIYISFLNSNVFILFHSLLFHLKKNVAPSTAIFFFSVFFYFFLSYLFLTLLYFLFFLPTFFLFKFFSFLSFSLFYTIVLKPFSTTYVIPSGNCREYCVR